MPSWIDADELDRAVLDALLETYTTVHSSTGRSTTTLPGCGMHVPAQHKDQLKIVAGEIRIAEAALDCYFAVFERGTMKEETCAPRIEALPEQLPALKRWQEGIEAAMDDEEVTVPTEDDLKEIRRRVVDAILNGSPAARKALL